MYYLRALGSLLARRFTARGGIPRAQAESCAWIGINKQAPGSSAARPANRSLHTLRGLAFGYAPGAAAAGAVAGFAVALLYFNKDTDKSAAEVTGVESRKEVPLHILQGLEEEEALKVKFMDKEGKMDWLGYLDYIDNRRYRGGKHYDREVIGKVVISSEDVEVEELKVDEEAMQAKFEAFMKEFDRSYKSEEEKAYRYGIFKKAVIEAERLNKRNASKPNGACFGTTQFSDWTEEEYNSWMGCTDPFPWEKYLSLRKSIIIEGRDRRGMTSKAKKPKNTQDVSSINN